MEEMCVLLHWRDRLPPANKELAERSLDVGALVTLWEGGVKPMRWVLCSIGMIQGRRTTAAVQCQGSTGSGLFVDLEARGRCWKM